MSSKYTLHQLAKILEELSSSLRELPDIPISDLKILKPTDIVIDSEMIEIAEILSNLSKDEAIHLLNDQTQKRLIDLCKYLKINIGSNKTKRNLVDQLIWHIFTAKDDLHRIRNYDETNDHKESS